MRESLGSIVLGFELVVVFLAALVLFGLQGAAAAGRARRGSGCSCVLMIVAVGLLRYPVGIVLGWVRAGSSSSPPASSCPPSSSWARIFAAMWTYCMIVGRADIDRDNAAPHRDTPPPPERRIR